MSESRRLVIEAFQVYFNILIGISAGGYDRFGGHISFKREEAGDIEGNLSVFFREIVGHSRRFGAGENSRQNFDAVFRLRASVNFGVNFGYIEIG